MLFGSACCTGQPGTWAAGLWQLRIHSPCHPSGVCSSQAQLGFSSGLVFVQSQNFHSRGVFYPFSPHQDFLYIFWLPEVPFLVPLVRNMRSSHQPCLTIPFPGPALRTKQPEKRGKRRLGRIPLCWPYSGPSPMFFSLEGGFSHGLFSQSDWELHSRWRLPWGRARWEKPLSTSNDKAAPHWPISLVLSPGHQASLWEFLQPLSNAVSWFRAPCVQARGSEKKIFQDMHCCCAGYTSDFSLHPSLFSQSSSLSSCFLYLSRLFNGNQWERWAVVGLLQLSLHYLFVFFTLMSFFLLR